MTNTDLIVEKLRKLYVPEPIMSMAFPCEYDDGPRLFNNGVRACIQAIEDMGDIR